MKGIGSSTVFFVSKGRGRNILRDISVNALQATFFKLGSSVERLVLPTVLVAVVNGRPLVVFHHSRCVGATAVALVVVTGAAVYPGTVPAVAFCGCSVVDADGM